MKTIRLAVVINVDGDVMYVPENTHGFENFPKPKLFDNLKDAEEERSKWNTGIIIDYETGLEIPRIKSFSDEERRRAKEREEKNNGE